MKGLVAVIKKNNPSVKKSDIAELRNKFNSNFYEIMSKDITAEGFDSKKYYKAMKEYTDPNDGLFNAYEYHNNPLEKDAYEITRKVLKILGKDPVVCADMLPANYKILMKLLKYNGIPQQYYEGQLQMLHSIAEVKNIETHENYKRFVEIFNDIVNKTEVLTEERTWFDGMLNRINEPYSGELTLKAVQTNQKCYKQIEIWLREGKFCPANLLKDM